MKYVPHDYQKYAEEFIINHPACALMLDMGLGKTVITLTAIWLLLFDYFEFSKVLVIAPLRVAQDTWSKSVEKWEHLNGLRISKIFRC
jgi:SNF2 family DNA or RNA helicase